MFIYTYIYIINKLTKSQQPQIIDVSTYTYAVNSAQKCTTLKHQ